LQLSTSSITHDLSTVTPTHGFNIKSLTHEKYKLHVWDIGGQRSLRDHWSSYIRNIDGLVYVVDSADPKRVREAGEELENLLLEK
jgi:ADP-ribosylation factor-like protein 3